MYLLNQEYLKLQPSWTIDLIVWLAVLYEHLVYNIHIWTNNDHEPEFIVYLMSSSTSDITKSSLFIFCMEHFSSLEPNDLRLVWLREGIICCTRWRSKDNEFKMRKKKRKKKEKKKNQGDQNRRRSYPKTQFKSRWANDLIITKPIGTWLQSIALWVI